MPFPPQKPGLMYLTEGGTETEIMYRYGYELPHFAAFTLLDNPSAMAELRGMYKRYLDVAAGHGFAVLMGGLDYRASPDWGRLLGYSAEGLKEFQLRAIEFLREVAAPYAGQLPDVKIAGVVGPRGDAYEHNHDITEAEAEDYHSQQMHTLSEAGVDITWGATFNNINEATGLARAAANAGVPLTISFTLDENHRLKSGPSLRQAIEAVDSRAGSMRPDFYGINCSHPLEFEPALEPGEWFNRVRSLRPNAAMMDKISLCSLGHLEEGDPQELGQMMGDLARRYPHVDVWGGCCGTWEKHMDFIARGVKAAHA